MKIRSLVLGLPLVVLVALTGCAADSSDTTSNDASEVNTSAPITLANYVSHPAIKSIRAKVNEIDSATLTEAKNPGCDGSNTKYTDAQGRIRRLVEEGGEGGFAGKTTSYYDTDGKVIFVFNMEADYTESNNTSPAKRKETRVYFDVSGKVIWQVMRDGEGDLEKALTTPDRLPTADEKFPSSEGYTDPAASFAVTGCPQPDKK